MIGREVQRKLQIDQREILAAAAGQRRADAVQRLGGAGLRRIDQRRQLLAGLGFAQAFLHQRMPRQLLVEGLIDRGRRGVVLVARQPARIIVGHAQHAVVELVGPLQPHAGVLFLAREFEDHAGMQVLEERIPFRAGQLVDIGDRRLAVAGAVAGPARQQRRHQVRDRPADRLVDVGLRGRVFLQFQVAHADHQARDAIGFVDRQDAVGELDGLVDIAVGERRNEGAVQKFVVLRIDAKRRTIEGRGRGRVALHAGMTRGQIAAGHGQRFQVVRARKLRRIVGGMIGRLRRQRARHGERGDGDGGNCPAIETNGDHHGSPWLQGLQHEGFTARSCDHSRMRTQPAASSRMTMPRLAFNRKDRGWRIDRQATPRPAARRLKTLAVWPYRGQPPARGTVPIKIGTDFPWFSAFSSRQRASTSRETPCRSRNRGHIAS